jgi:hypothetical protein
MDESLGKLWPLRGEVDQGRFSEAIIRRGSGRYRDSACKYGTFLH